MKNHAVTPTRGEQTRQAILTAAYDLIIQQGFAATSMRQIAEDAGLALGSIYNHFSSKDEVFRAIIQERHPFLRMIPLLSSVEGNNRRDLRAKRGAHPGGGAGPSSGVPEPDAH